MGMYVQFLNPVKFSQSPEAAEKLLSEFQTFRAENTGKVDQIS